MLVILENLVVWHFFHIQHGTCTMLDQTIERGTFLGTAKPQRHIGFLF